MTIPGMDIFLAEIVPLYGEAGESQWLIFRRERPHNNKMRIVELLIMLLPFFLYNECVIKYSVSRL